MPSTSRNGKQRSVAILVLFVALMAGITGPGRALPSGGVSKVGVPPRPSLGGGPGTPGLEGGPDSAPSAGFRSLGK